MNRSPKAFFVFSALTVFLCLSPSCLTKSPSNNQNPNDNTNINVDSNDPKTDVLGSKLAEAKLMLFKAFEGDIDLDGIEAAIGKHSDVVLQSDKDGNSGLHLAAQQKNYDAFITLAENEALLSAKNNQLKTPIQIGEENGFFADDLQFSDNDDFSFFLERAVTENFAFGVDWAISKNANIYAFDGGGDNTLLHLAASLGHMEAAKSLLKNDPSGDALKTAKNSQNKTPFDVLPDSASKEFKDLLRP